MQKQRLCYKTNDLLYSARIYKRLMSFTAPEELYRAKKTEILQKLLQTKENGRHL